MSQTGYSKVQIYSSSTASNTPSASNLLNDTNGSELGINITDGKLFYKDNSGTVQVMATKGTGPIGGSNTQIQYNSSGALTGSANLTFNGTTLTANTLNLTNALGTAYGGTGLTSFTANGVVYASSTSALATGSGLLFDGSNLGLGVTPSAWQSGRSIIELGGSVTGQIVFNGSSNNGFMATNVYNSGSGNIYKNTNYAVSYNQTSGQHQWYTAPSGTAGNPITAFATPVMTLDNSGNLGVGTSSPASKLDVKVGANNGAISFGRTATELEIFVANGNDQYLGGTVAGSVGVRSITGALFLGTASGQSLVLETNSIERVCIDNSGNLLVGLTTATGTPNSGAVIAAGAAVMYMGHPSGTGSGAPYLGFNYNGGAIGSITQSGTTAVLYSTTSDYRLKSNVQPVTSGLSVINQLNPVNFTWISDNEADTGFLAHEFQSVIPRSVTGEKDATKTEEYEITPAVKDENGNVTTPAVMGTRTVPVYQQMDNSGAVPYLVAAIKELSAKVTALEAKVGI